MSSVAPVTSYGSNAAGKGTVAAVLFRIAVVYALMLVLPLKAVAGPVVQENQAFARFLVLFARYVEWPGQTDGEPPSKPFVVGILGHDPFGIVLEQAFAGQLPGGREVVVSRIGSAVEARGCDMVFISREESRRQAVWLRELAGLPVLTVAETEAALSDGACIVITTETTEGGYRPRFDVNRSAFDSCGLKASSRMLVHARRIVYEKKKGG